MRLKNMFISVVVLSLFLSGCTASINSYQYYQGMEDQKELVALPIKTETVRRVKIFDDRVSYRNDKKATVEFSWPEAIRNDTGKIEMILTAYNDDKQYLRAIWFEVDGAGGYIGTRQIAPGQLRGDGTIAVKEQKTLQFDLAECPVSSARQGEEIINYTQKLLTPGTHTITSWISTYGQYGPDSRITIELILRSAN